MPMLSKKEDEDIKLDFTEIRTIISIQSDSSEDKIYEFIKFIDETCPVAETLRNNPKMTREVKICR